MKTKKRVLIAILNWGLGHATRCMPIIQHLLKMGIEPILASDGRALLLLQKEYPNLKTIDLPAYNVTYRSENMMWNIAPQIPKILKAIRQEHKALPQIIKDYQIDAIISDNRFGCYTSTIPSVFITHQVNIKIPFQGGAGFINYLNRQFIKRYNTCWIPDVPTSPNLAGTLSDATQLENHQYIGILSRLKYEKRPKKYDIAVVLSGPEPQRTFLEKSIIQQLQKTTYKAIVIKGKTDENEHTKPTKYLELYSFLTAKKLNQILLESDVIITRSGYSTLMDLVFLKKKAILIPTPGQTEQEYLATNFHQKGIFYSSTQKNFDLEKAMIQTPNFTGFDWGQQEDLLEKAIVQFLKF